MKFTTFAIYAALAIVTFTDGADAARQLMFVALGDAEPITENTLMPIGVIAAIVGAAIAGTWWVSNDRSAILNRLELIERKVDHITHRVDEAFEHQNGASGGGSE